jgi:hypothetical protein
MEREARLQGILHISQKPHLSGSPVKEPSLKVPFLESLAERCPTTRGPLHSSIKVHGIYQVPLGSVVLQRIVYKWIRRSENGCTRTEHEEGARPTYEGNSACMHVSHSKNFYSLGTKKVVR